MRLIFSCRQKVEARWLDVLFVTVRVACIITAVCRLGHKASLIILTRLSKLT